MSFNAAARHYWRSILVANGTGGARSFASSTIPKMKHFNPTADSVHSHHPPPKSRMAALKGDFVPIAVVFGLVAVALAIGVHTAKQQLFHSPAVQISKKRRESIQEVEDPDYVMVDSNKFLNKSFLRKVAHIQDHDPTQTNPTRPNIYTRNKVESLDHLFPNSTSIKDSVCYAAVVLSTTMEHEIQLFTGWL
ncbi:hypothetical protein TEA_000272 [Camellia sinensis var. sinensis]|uniref:Uncharacterized protein n=1 Tax=Camellia sinensis var. sinensis TaxID=542762 RepID=A0A4S4EX86_CAMSN|nr:hypothetical protein TEA_000272 [Camellia sinensis var. sinensis]